MAVGPFQAGGDSVGDSTGDGELSIEQYKLTISTFQLSSWLHMPGPPASTAATYVGNQNIAMNG